MHLSRTFLIVCLILETSLKRSFKFCYSLSGFACCSVFESPSLLFSFRILYITVFVLQKYWDYPRLFLTFWDLFLCFYQSLSILRRYLSVHPAWYARQSMLENCPNTEFFLACIFHYPYFSVLSPNAGKNGPEKTPYLDTFHAVNVNPLNFSHIMISILRCFACFNMIIYS